MVEVNSPPFFVYIQHFLYFCKNETYKLTAHTEIITKKYTKTDNG